MHYIPRRDSLARDYLMNFAAKLSAEPARWFVSGPDAEHLAHLVRLFDESYRLITDPDQRTAPRLLAKDRHRNAAEQLCRVIAMQVKLNPGICDQDKLALGIRPVNPTRLPISVPATQPVLELKGALKGSHTLAFQESGSSRRGKPAGAIGLQLFVAITQKATDNPAEGHYYGTFGRAPVGVAFDNADDGKVASYFARWVSRRGETGPWSSAVSMRIAA